VIVTACVLHDLRAVLIGGEVGDRRDPLSRVETTP